MGPCPRSFALLARSNEGWGAGVTPCAPAGVCRAKGRGLSRACTPCSRVRDSVGGEGQGLGAYLSCAAPSCAPRLPNPTFVCLVCGQRRVARIGHAERGGGGTCSGGVHAVPPPPSPCPVCTQPFTPRSERVANVAHVDKDGGGRYVGKPGAQGPHTRGRGAHVRQLRGKKGRGLPPVRVVNKGAPAGVCVYKAGAAR